ncbi:hypothetical protein DFQ26_006838 [Actinomortierella ambigua]|nr:hypothetical protein DFQ26_006838 [Actinomortierella ambigua]
MPPPPPVERRAPRVYGIDAADHVPLPARLPPPAPSAAYNSSSQLYASRQDRHPSAGHSSQSYQGQQHGSYSESYAYSSPSSPAPYPLPKDPRYHHDSGYGARYGSDEMRPSYPISPSMDLDRSSKYHRGHSVSEMSDVRLPTYPGPRQYYSASQPSSRRASEQSSMAEGNGDGWPVRHSFSYQSSRSSYPTPPATHSYGSTHGMNGNHDSYASSSQDREALASPQEDYSQSRAHFYAHSVHPFDTDVPPPPPLAPGSSGSLSGAEDGLQGSSSIKDEKRKSSSASKRTRVTEEKKIVVDNEEFVVKAKRKRANASQLSVLNAAFARSYFPSTEERLRLSKQCKMCPRTVQIWFQNKRQSVKAKSEAMEAAMAVAASRAKEQERQKERIKNGGELELPSTTTTTTTTMMATTKSVVTSTAVTAAMGTGAESTGAEKRRSSDTMTTADAVVEALQIQLDGRGVDYFSRKRRATVAFMTSK